MLVLGRNVGEYVVINENIFVRVVKQNGDLKLAIDAPKDIKIERGEIFEKRSGRPASMARYKPVFPSFEYRLRVWFSGFRACWRAVHAGA